MNSKANIIDKFSSSAAVRDVQERLQILGYVVDPELKSGEFGVLTSAAVVSFRQTMGFSDEPIVDRQTWTALVDATFTFGDRLLYLRMPYFHGADVKVLQTALAALGFSCPADGIFGLHTEHAVREFQQNAGIRGDGIVGDSTFKAINRLRHAWKGKELLRPDNQALGFARAAEVLETHSICIYGTDELTRSIAARISNLALATTVASKVSSAQSLDQVPDDSTLMIRLCDSVNIDGEFSCVDIGNKAAKSNDCDHKAGSIADVPQVVFDSDATINARLATALSLTAAHQPRIVIMLVGAWATDERTQMRERQHCAITLLDAICLALLEMK